MQRRFSGRTTDRLETLEDRLLAPYAHRSVGVARRFAVEDPGRTLAYRTAFQRDRDRILHSLAFRRLKHKTQVYVPYEGDHHRTRLTHTLEVAQVGRTMARALGLSEDLVEAVALGHDLGQPPFGGAGEEVLSALLSGQESLEGVERQALAASGGFRPNYQGVRVVDRLEQRYDHPGLNLTDPVREGILKCGRIDPGIEYPDWVDEGLRADEPPTLESQVVRTADRLARLAHDLEDGIRAGEVALQAAERLRLGNAVVSKLGDRYRRLSRYRRQNALVRGMIHLLVSDVVVRAASRLEDWLTESAPEDARRVRWRDGADDEAGPAPGEEADEEARERDPGREPPRLPTGTVGFSERIGEMVDELESLVETQVYRSFAVSRLDARARTFIKGMFSAYYRDPLQLDDYVLLRYRSVAGGPFLRDLPGDEVQKEVASRYRGQPPFVRLIADHIAGMSDSFALKEYERLYLPFPEAEGH